MGSINLDMLTPEALIAIHPELHPDTARSIAAKMREIGGIALAKSSFDRMVQDENKRHAAELARIAKARGETQKSCDHKLNQYHGDPSGNNDSWIECRICGAEVNRAKAYPRS